MPNDSRPAVLELIGNTPLVRVSRFDTGPCTLFLKLESQNPGGSIKDRIGLAMIDAAERDGRLKPGGTIVEATAGNTGLGLALVGRAKGYRVVLVVPPASNARLRARWTRWAGSGAKGNGGGKFASPARARATTPTQLASTAITANAAKKASERGRAQRPIRPQPKPGRPCRIRRGG